MRQLGVVMLLCEAILGLTGAGCAVAAAGEVGVADEAGQIAAHPALITRHRGVFGGKSVRYTATVEGLDVPDAKGGLGARLVSIAYVVDGGSNESGRPVMFVFNGGPITASLWLHIGVMGPKRLALPDDLKADPETFKLVDNPYSPLDATDLVFVDPASTGFSRVAPGVSPSAYFSVAADGQQVAAFIVQWLTAHHRLDSPVFLLGESYGTLRAAEVAGQLAELPRPILLGGVVLMGQAVNIVEYSQRPQNIISYVVSLPTLAAIGWYHGKVKAEGKSLVEFVNQAWSYAQSDYLPALFLGKDLSPVERDRVAARLEELTGISASYYRDHNLRITKEQYRGQLLKDQGLLLGRMDARYVGPLTAKGVGPDSAMDVIDPAYRKAFLNYLQDDLKVTWKETYIPATSPDGGLDGWSWGGTSPFSDWPYTERLNKALVANPRCRVFIGNGYYDTQTTVGAAILAARQASWPRDRVTLGFYEGGHMPYTVERSAAKFGADMRAFVSDKP